MADQPARDIIVVGASAGGIHALHRVLAGIPPGFPGTIAMVLHRSPFHRDTLARVIANETQHVVREPRHGELIEPGSVYLAPRDYHLTIFDHRFRLVRGPKEHFTRPAIDALFRSAAEACGARVIGVLLTGGGRDGASGLNAIKAAGGVNVIQDPDDAESPAMPRYAVEQCDPDAVVPLDDIAKTIVALMRGHSLSAGGSSSR